MAAEKTVGHLDRERGAEGEKRGDLIRVLERRRLESEKSRKTAAINTKALLPTQSPELLSRPFCL